VTGSIYYRLIDLVWINRMHNKLMNYNILSTEQYGFRLGLRTDNATYKLTTEILNAMNNKLLVGGFLFLFFILFRGSI
jgi:hypothetical protein